MMSTLETCQKRTTSKSDSESFYKFTNAKIKMQKLSLFDEKKNKKQNKKR